MIKCKDCKYWEAEKSKSFQEDGISYKKPITFSGFGYCKKVTAFYFSGLNQITVSTANYDSTFKNTDSNVHPFFSSREFGCIVGEPLENGEKTHD